MTYTALAWNSCSMRNIWKSLGSRHGRCLFIHNRHQDSLYQPLVSEGMAAVVTLGCELVCEMALINQESLHQTALSLKTACSTYISTIQCGGKITKLVYRNWSCCSRKKCPHRLILLFSAGNIYITATWFLDMCAAALTQTWVENLFQTEEV